MWRVGWFVLGVVCVPTIKLAFTVWRYRQIDRKIDTLIGRPEYRYTGFDEGLRELTAKRRTVAEQTKRKAHAIESGTKTEDLLRRRA